MSLKSITVAVPHTLSVAEVLRRLKELPPPWPSMVSLKQVRAQFKLGTALGEITGMLTVNGSEVRIDTEENPLVLQPFDPLIERTIKSKLTEALKP